MKLYEIDLPAGEKPQRMLQKAYVKYSSVATKTKDPSLPAGKSRWGD
jgi:hypothetical protein